MIENQTIQGFLDTSGTFDTVDDDYLILGTDKIHCAIHDGELSISAPYYQCLKCFRIVCADCYSTQEAGGMRNCIFCGGEMQSALWQESNFQHKLYFTNHVNRYQIKQIQRLDLTKNYPCNHYQSIIYWEEGWKIGYSSK